MYICILVYEMSLDRETTGNVPADPRSQLLQEMREQNFDLIRFASYRTACKLRYVQKKCNCKYINFVFNI